jgi:hypothetical protein
MQEAREGKERQGVRKTLDWRGKPAILALGSEEC